MSTYSDEQLVLEALDDSHPAFEQLIGQYQYRVLRTIASIVSDEQAVQDVAQETFLSAWNNLSKLKEKQRFGRWLNQIAINFAKRWLREQRRHQEHTASFKDMISLTQERRYQSDRLRHEVWEAVDELTEDYREAVILHYISGYSYKEISKMLSVPFSTVVGRLQHARNQLRKEFLDMVTKLQLEIDSTVHKFLKERAKQDGLSIEGLIIRLIERYRRDMDNPEIGVRKVWDSGSTDARPSPDGRHICMINWWTGNLAIRDLTTGEARDITANERKLNFPSKWAMSYAWSPDSKQIAYDWAGMGHDELRPHDELRIIGLDGSEPRVLYTSDSVGIIIHEWSQDGNSILACLYEWPNCPNHIVLVSAADGDMRTLKSLDYSKPLRMSLSPDGRYVVYDRQVKEDNGSRGIFLLATDGSGEIPLVEHPDADNYCPVWAPDGKTIVFVSNRDPGGARGLWFIHVVNGKPTGEPQFIKREAVEVFPLGFTQDGSLYYGTYADWSDIYVARLDLETGQLLSAPTLQRSEGKNAMPDWSPDGKSLAYVSRRVSLEGTGSRPFLVIRSVETGEEREIPLEMYMIAGFGYWTQTQIGGALRWSPDGSIILCSSYHTRDFYLIDVKTGDINSIELPSLRDEVWPKAAAPTWSPDGETIFYITRHIDTQAGEVYHSIMAHDLKANQERELCPVSIFGWNLAISPDGQQLAFADEENKALRVIPTAGGEVREFISPCDEAEGFYEHVSPIAWTPDGRYLLFLKDRHSSGGSPGSSRILLDELWRIPAEGGKPQKLLELESGQWKASLHPDGQRIAFARGGPVQNELWVMENLLTTFAADK